MINDECRQFLESAHEAKLEIRRMTTRAEALKNQCMSMTREITDMPRGGGKDQNDALAAYADAIEQARRSIAKHQRMIMSIEQFISSIPGSGEKAGAKREILRLRYLERKSWSSIQRTMSYSERQTYRLHGEALNDARQLWDRQKKKAATPVED